MSYRQVTLNKNLARMPRFADSMRSYGIAMKDLASELIAPQTHFYTQPRSSDCAPRIFSNLAITINHHIPSVAIFIL